MTDQGNGICYPPQFRVWAYPAGGAPNARSPCHSMRRRAPQPSLRLSAARHALHLAHRDEA